MAQSCMANPVRNNRAACLEGSYSSCQVVFPLSGRPTPAAKPEPASSSLRVDINMNTMAHVLLRPTIVRLALLFHGNSPYKL